MPVVQATFSSNNTVIYDFAGRQDLNIKLVYSFHMVTYAELITGKLYREKL